MGKASRWFRGLLGLNKKKWTFSRAHKEHPLLPTSVAAVAEAAPAPAPAVVVKRAAGTADAYFNREERAAVTIQSHFRSYLARRALRALKALIKLQALAKGYIFRKQFSEYLRQMQAVERAQARLRAGRISNSEASNSSTKSSSINQNSPVTLEKFGDVVDQAKRRQPSTLKRNGLKSNGGPNLIHCDSEYPHYSVRSRWMGRRTSKQLYELQQGSSTRNAPMDDERNDKILEVDPGNPTRMYRHTFHSSHDLTDQSWSPLKFEESRSPQCYSASSVGGGSKRGPLTPNKSEGLKCNYTSDSYYLDHPSYMAYTESSKAKVRSVSAPRQRFQEERLSSMNRYSVHVFGNNGNESRVNSTQKVSALHASFTSKAYPGSGRLDRMGIPVRDVLGFSGGHWQRFY